LDAIEAEADAKTAEAKTAVPKADTQSQATKLIKLLSDVEFFHTADQKTYATFALLSKLAG